MGFWESIRGHQFVDGTIPKLVATLDRIADVLEKYIKDDVMLEEVPKLPLDLSIYNHPQQACPRCEKEAVLVKTDPPQKEGYTLAGCSMCLFKWYEKYDDGRKNALASALRLILKDVFEAEVADHVSYEHLNVAVELSNFQEEYPNIMVREVWEDDRIQFARLICELNASQSPFDYSGLREGMDLPNERIDELFDRAHKVWEASKQAICPPEEHNDTRSEDSG